MFEQIFHLGFWFFGYRRHRKGSGCLILVSHRLKKINGKSLLVEVGIEESKSCLNKEDDVCSFKRWVSTCC
ncbi:hypothetical protein Hanom_Chr16g01441941 [Helianthus anomalus]